MIKRKKGEGDAQITTMLIAPGGSVAGYSLAHDNKGGHRVARGGLHRLFRPSWPTPFLQSYIIVPFIRREDRHPKKLPTLCGQVWLSLAH